MANFDFSHVNVKPEKVEKEPKTSIIDSWFEDIRTLCNEKPFVTQLEVYKLIRGDNTILTEEDFPDNDTVGFAKDPFGPFGFMKVRKVYKPEFGGIVLEQILD